MDKTEFLKKFDEVCKDGNYGKRSRDSVHDLIRQHMVTLNQPGVPLGFQELFIAIEELAELIQATTKALRGKKDTVNIVEELADVRLVIEYIEEALDVDPNEVEIALEVKIRKLEHLLHNAKEKDIGMHDKPERDLL